MKIGEKISISKEMSELMKDNRGFSLIELIVVMALVSVLAVGAMLGARALRSGDVRNTAGRIDDMLELVKTENMTKNQRFYLVIEKQNDKHFLIVERGNIPISKEELVVEDGIITFFLDNGLSFDVGDESTGSKRLEICFDKASGRVSKNKADEIVTRIVINSGTRTSTIHLVKLTGKHYIE